MLIILTIKYHNINCKASLFGLCLTEKYDCFTVNNFQYFREKYRSDIKLWQIDCSNCLWQLAAMSLRDIPSTEIKHFCYANHLKHNDVIVA